MRLLPDEDPVARDLPPIGRVQAELARRSLADFVRHSWSVLDAEPLQWNWHLDVICAHVQALLELRIPKRKLLINVPPGSMKSRIVSVAAPAWQWLREPSWTSIFSSANPRVMVRDSLKCRRLIESRWYQQTFRPRWGFAGDQNAKTLYYTDAGGFRLSVSNNAAVTGDRAQSLFWDDLLDAKDTQHVSQARRQATNFWLDVVFSTRMSNPEKGTMCGICQRLHEDDPAGHVMKRGDYEELVIPQIYEPPKAKNEGDPIPEKPRTVIGYTDPRTKPGQLMFPARFSSAWLRGERVTLGEAMFEAQHQQRPSPLGGLIFKREWWKFYKKPANWEQLTPADLFAALGIDRVAVGWDTALGEKQQNDYTSSTVIGRTANKYLVLGHTLKKMQFPEVESSVIASWSRWNPHGVPIEGNGSASGKAVVQSLKTKSRVPALEVPNIAKEVRAAIVSPTVEAGLVYLPEGEPWVEGFIHSLGSFPRGSHDDDVDSFCIALEWLLFGTKKLEPRAISA